MIIMTIAAAIAPTLVAPFAFLVFVLAPCSALCAA
jgi:hypothetical protein